MKIERRTGKDLNVKLTNDKIILDGVDVSHIVKSAVIHVGLNQVPIVIVEYIGGDIDVDLENVDLKDGT